MTVYALSQPGATLVKIGHAGDLRARVRGLMAGSPVPLVLRGHWDGDTGTEARLHRHFAACRRHGEWFDFGDVDPVAAISAALGCDASPPADVGDVPRSRPPAAPVTGPPGQWDCDDGPPVPADATARAWLNRQLRA